MAVSLLIVVLVLALVGFLLYTVPMDVQYKRILYVLVAVIVVVYLIGLLAGWPVALVR